MSPSTVGFVAMMTSFTVPSFSRSIKDAIRSLSGPIPSSGAITPPSTWKSPLYSPKSLIVETSFGCSTTQIVLLSRIASEQIGHGSFSVHEPQTEHSLILSCNVSICFANRIVQALSAFRMWLTSRPALFTPIPGKRENDSVNSSMAFIMSSVPGF